ncbi:expressed unknown protein [Seminavis robusta]|uniref:Uncharacterized protein n=1 Tax=Seminavis robusta TaxID=568900 RepID=A0A9N8DB03_9STRA|nr:expressed unknown protein [Seminavis robusta]|eukprot:Sro39_g024240.1 n/a (261) ;mRNA; f:115092-116071
MFRQLIINSQALFVLAAVLCPRQVGAVCLLCEDGVDGLKYPFAVIKSDGTSCTKLAVSVAVDYEEGSSQCTKQIQAWREICCGDKQPIDVDITDVFDEYPDIDSIQQVGPYEKCNVCRDGDYPSTTSMVLTMLYIGSGSCAQYWKVGQQGLIPDHLCDPLQYFAYEPCGCGEFSTNGNYHWSEDSEDESSNDDKTPWWSNADSLFGDDQVGNTEGNTDGDWWSGADSFPSSSASYASRTWLYASAHIVCLFIISTGFFAS